MKGVLAMAGVAQKFVYQGVHMQFKVRGGREGRHSSKQGNVGRAVRVDCMLGPAWHACVCTPQTPSLLIAPAGRVHRGLGP